MHTEPEPACLICEETIQAGQWKFAQGSDVYHLACYHTYESEFAHFS
jgi:hypothetical protein